MEVVQSHTKFKVCKRCSTSKAIDEFGANRRLIGGLFHNCKVCVNEKNRAHIKSKPEEYKARRVKWETKNRDKVKESKLKYANKPEVKEYRTIYRREYKRSRYASDVRYKLTQNIRCRMTGLFKKTPSTKALSLLGCSVDDYKTYLEAKFEAGMSWENHQLDGWHIDHIVPISSFDLTNVDELRKAFHYTNTQPLWASENFKKKDKLNWKREQING